MGALEDLAALYGEDEGPSQGSALDALAAAYADDDDELSVEEQRAQLYGNAMPAGQLAMDDSSIAADVLGGTGSDLLRAAGLFGSNVVGGLAGAQEFVGDVASQYGVSENQRRAGEMVSGLMGDERLKQEFYRDEVLGMADPTISEGRKSGIGIASNLPQLGLFGVNPALGLGVVGAQAFGEEAAQAKAAGATLAERGLSGAVTAGAEIVAEKVLGDARLLKSLKEASALPLKGAKQAVRNILVNAGLEGSDEVVSQVLSRVGQEAIYLDSYSGTEQEKKAQRAEDLSGVWEAFKGGAFVGGAATGAMLNAGSRQAAPPTPSAPTVAPTAFEPGTSPTEAALVQVDALFNEAQRAERERELAELPLEASISETEQQIEALRQLENQAAAAAAIAEREAELDYQARLGEESDKITDKFFEPNPNWPNQWKDVVGLDKSIGERSERMVEEKEDGPQFPIAPKVMEFGGNLGVYSEFDSKASDFPKPVGPTEEVLDETSDMARQIEHAAASKEAVAIAQAPGSTFDAIMLGDPSRLGSQEYFASQRVQLEERLAGIKAQYEQMKAGVKDAGDGAAKEVMTDAQAREALETIRRGALEQALRMGDPDLFDRLDVKTRRRMVLFPEDLDETIALRNERARSEFGSATLPETMAELRDVSVAAMPAVEAKANKDFDILAKAGNVPANEIGAPMSREEFVRGQVLEFQTGLTERFRALMFEAKPDGSNATEIMRKARSLINKTLKSKGLTREQIGFRGDAALERQGIVDEGAEWLQSRFGEKKITDLTDAELVALAQEARQQSAPISTYEFIRSELKRRAANEPPVRYGPAKGDPESAQRAAQEAVETELEPKLRELLGSDPKVYKPGVGDSWLEKNLYWWRRFVGRMGGLFRSNTSLGPAGFGPGGALSTHYYNADLADSVSQLRNGRQRNAAIKLMGSERDAARAEAAALNHKIMSWANEVQKGLRAYVGVQKANGNPVTMAEAEQQLYEAVTERRAESLPPDLQQIVKDSEPIRSEFKGYARQLAAGDPAKLAEIERLGDAYIFRSYAIHKDPDAAFKEVDKKSAPYQRFYAKVVKEGYGPLYEEAYRDAAPKLRDAGYTEPQIQKIVEEQVMASMIPGLIEHIVKSKVGSKETTPSVTARIAKATKETLIERVIDDPDLRAMLGEEKVFSLAMVQGMEKVASDMARLRLTTGLMGVWRQLGLVGDIQSPNRTVKLSKAKLDKISTDDADVDGVWVAPEVEAVLNGVRNASDGFDQLASQIVAFTKMGYVANPGTALQNWWGLGQSVLTAGGINGAFAALTKRAALTRYAHLVARELSFPGKGVSAVKPGEANRLFSDLGISPDGLKDAVLQIQELGLDVGGELAFEFEKGAGALLSGAEKVSSERVSTKLKKGANFAMELYRHPDLMSKVMAYQFWLDELRIKAGVTEASPEIRKEAARRALEVTQNPASTPEIIRAMNKGRLGIFTFSFAGFQYQMMRNLYHAAKYATQDAAASIRYGREASRLEAAGNMTGAAKARQQASLYGKFAVNRAAGVATASVVVGDLYRRGITWIWEALGGEDESEKERHLKAILPFEEQRANKMTPVRVWKEGGKTYATIAHTGRVDIYDGAMSVLRTLAENPQGEKAIPTDGAELGRRVMSSMGLLKEQFTGLSAFAEATGTFLRLVSEDGTTASDWVKAGSRAVRQLAPKGAVIPTEIVTRGIAASKSGALEFSSEFPFVEGDPTNADYEKFRRNLVRSATGIGVQTIPVDDYWSSRTHDVWGEASWRRDARNEWKAASTPSAKIKVKAKYADQWENLQNSLWNLSEHGLGADLTPDAMKKALGDQEVTKYKGEKIPKWMHQKVAYRIPVSLDTYLNESVKGIR